MLATAVEPIHCKHVSNLDVWSFAPICTVYKREQKGKREAAADRRKQKAVVVAAQSLDTQPHGLAAPGPSQPAAADSCDMSGTVKESRDSSGSGAGTSQSGCVRGEEKEEGEGDEVMETDPVVEQLSGTNAPAISSVS